MEKEMELAYLGGFLTMFDQRMGTFAKQLEAFRTDTRDRSSFHFKNMF